MSEMKDDIIYKFYDYVKAIYIYSHLKTHLIDKDRQRIEKITNIILLAFSLGFIIFSAFKIIVIIFYFIFVQAFSAFIYFIIAIFKTRLKINFYSSFINALSYLGKVFKRIYTFNFYRYENGFIGFLMIFSYFFFLFLSSVFYHLNFYLFEKNEKPKYYLITFYFHFESIILNQLLFSSFYACRNMIRSTLIAFGIFFIMNIMLALGFLITKINEDADGSYEYNEPQGVMNIIFNSILLFVNSISLFKVISYNKNGKFVFY